MQWVVHEVPPEMSGTGSGRAERLGADMLGVGVGLGEDNCQNGHC